VIQANLFAEVAALEVDAQASNLLSKRADTFAAGADIHSRPIPPAVRDNEYRPGALPPEYPALLAGCRADRVHRSESLSARAGAVVDVTRNIVALEIEDAYYRWEEAAAQVGPAREAAEAGTSLANQLEVTHRNEPTKVKIDEVITARVLASTARQQYNEFLYREILALADLERATGGALCAGLQELLTRPAPAAAPAKVQGASWTMPRWTK
jgi:hypothetical protein